MTRGTLAMLLTCAVLLSLPIPPSAATSARTVIVHYQAGSLYGIGGAWCGGGESHGMACIGVKPTETHAQITLTDDLFGPIHSSYDVFSPTKTISGNFCGQADIVFPPGATSMWVVAFDDGNHSTIDNCILDPANIDTGGTITVAFT
ncbi:MAG: hypothetical protein ACYDCK_13595 [Thermoplasmatota archaeon]